MTAALIRQGVYVSEAQASWGFWEARCGCCRYGAEQLRRFQPSIECRVCGMVTDVVWPAEAMVFGIERLLMMRPDPTTRNWRPEETLRDLMTENGLHGIFDRLKDTELDSVPGVSLFSVDDERVVTDRLPALKARIRKEIT